MTQYEIIAMISCDEARFAGIPFTVAAKRAVFMEAFPDCLPDQDLAGLMQIGGAIGQYGIDNCRQPSITSRINAKSPPKRASLLLIATSQQPMLSAWCS